jgi:acyl carrier protein
MGFWGSVWSGIKSVAKAAVEVVTTAVKEVGKALVEKATEYLNLGIDALQKVVGVVETIAKALGIIKPEDDSEDLGDRAMRAEKTIEDFDTTRDYINYLKQEIRAKTKDELEKLSPEERLARKALGTSILSKAIEEEFDTSIPVEFWEKATKAGLGSKEIQEILQKFKDVGIEPSQFVKYLKRELNIKDEDKIEDVLVDAYRNLEPNANQKEIEEKILSMQRKI